MLPYPNSLVVLALLLASSVLSVQALPPSLDDSEIILGSKHTLYSEHLGEERHYWVSLPASYNEAAYAPSEYPVIYVLDGSAHFASLSGLVDHMGAGHNGNTQIPEAIVVAVLNAPGKRMLDMTPTASATNWDGTLLDIPIGGGGNAFLDFIEDELAPKIEKEYRASDHRSLFGHSMGGLIVLHALVRKPHFYNGIVAVDSAILWDDEFVLKAAKDQKDAFSGSTSRAYISLAGGEQVPGSTVTTSNERFHAFLQQSSILGAGAKYEVIPNEDHGSVPLLSHYQGLLHIFEGYRAPAEIRHDADKILAHYRDFSEKVGVRFQMTEKYSAWMARILEMRQKMAKAELFLRLATELYPQSIQAHLRLGHFYSRQKNSDKALEAFRKVLVLDPDNSVALKASRGALKNGSS